MKKVYDKSVMQIFRFDAEDDVITASPGGEVGINAGAQDGWYILTAPVSNSYVGGDDE